MLGPVNVRGRKYKSGAVGIRGMGCKDCAQEVLLHKWRYKAVKDPVGTLTEAVAVAQCATERTMEWLQLVFVALYSAPINALTLKPFPQFLDSHLLLATARHDNPNTFS